MGNFTSVFLWVVIGAVLVFALPYALHLKSLRLDQSIVKFSASVWRALPFTLLYSGSALYFAGTTFIEWFRSPVGDPALLFALVPIALFGWFAAVSIRLHASYWRHDRDATLVIDVPSERAIYANKEVLIDFALADIVGIEEHWCDSGRTPWSQYEYEVLRLNDGTDILFTCLFYSLLGPNDFFPKATRTLERHRICWLPGSEQNVEDLS